MPVATAIRNSAIPVVSGVGHEVDVTIAEISAQQPRLPLLSWSHLTAHK